jgi:hypothetical protein
MTVQIVTRDVLPITGNYLLPAFMAILPAVLGCGMD